MTGEQGVFFLQIKTSEKKRECKINTFAPQLAFVALPLLKGELINLCPYLIDAFLFSVTALETRHFKML